MELFIVTFRRHDRTRRRFFVNDADLARALVWAGQQLGFSIHLQTPGGQLFAG